MNSRVSVVSTARVVTRSARIDVVVTPAFTSAMTAHAPVGFYCYCNCQSGLENRFEEPIGL